MHAITARDRNAGPAGMSLTDMPYPRPAGYDDERAVFNLNHGLSPAVALTRTHDPTTMFRLDHNVLPAD